MLLFVLFMSCVLQPLVHYYGVNGRRESLHRFVVEDGAKPAIFGSYSYDPVKQVFVPPPTDGEQHVPGEITTASSHIPDQFVNNSFILSTAVGETDPDHIGPANHSDPVFRKHATTVTVTPNWRSRPKSALKNITSKTHKLNKI